MPRRRLNWTYDDDKQQFTTPTGRLITLHEIAGLIQDRAECRVDLEGPWAGWRIRGPALIPPRGSIKGVHLKPHNLAAFLRWAAPPTANDSSPSIAQVAHWRPAAAYTSIPAPGSPSQPRNVPTEPSGGAASPRQPVAAPRRRA